MWWRRSSGTDPASVRAANRKTLHKAGFRFADSLPLPAPGTLPVRPHDEIVKRLAALQALCLYVAAPPEKHSDASIRQMIVDHGLDTSLTGDESEILAITRGQASQSMNGLIGWRMENMVPLAWALGHAVVPGIDGRMIGGEDLKSILSGFGPLNSQSCATMLKSQTLRPAAEIVAMEDLFYCAHNAVRTAQFSDRRAVPPSFDPVANGGVIHERRHALTWMVSPGVAWEDTDLST